jgi:hypothetical protein
MLRFLVAFLLGGWLVVPPAAAAEGSLCFDPEGVEIPFACGELGVVLVSGAEDLIDTVLARSAPGASVMHRASDIHPPGTEPTELDFRTYALRVPVGDEIRLRDQLASDPLVEDAQLVHLGGTANPDTATAVDESGRTGLVTWFGMTLIVIAGLLRVRTARAGRHIGNATS